MTDLIGQVRGASYGTCGQPRVCAGLQCAHGIVVSRKTVALLMRRAGLSGVPLCRRGQARPGAEDSDRPGRRKFIADGPNRLRVTGITEHPASEGKLCGCIVTGVFSRRVAGWAIDSA